jgi:hypothetical protein
MDSYLERLWQELDHATGKASVSEMTQARAGKWTPAQILEHLFLTYKGTNAGLTKCVEQGAPLANRGTIRDRFAAMLVVNGGYIPEGRKAPDRAMPRGMSLEEIRPAMVAELQKMSSSLDDCERRFGVRTKILDHPFLGPLTANQWRKFHWVHGRHHLRQIRERMRTSSGRGL